MNERHLFVAALRQLDEESRAAFLIEACGDNAELRESVEALLREHRELGSFLEAPAADIETTAAASNVLAERPGTVIGRYKLLEAIGEGGMGTVWVAEQSHPVKRKVALKLIKAGMDSKSVVARFEAERQALAVMDHPNIAKVLDGGLTETGRPYFVMEYVKGVPITEYCDATRMSVPERLALFVQVCSAVQHAHQKGIIHRDLKPSNILVAPYDDKPVPKVIDFGLAKAMHQSLTERSLHTAHETVLGTPLYMSPEQAQLNNLDIDTRSDIYSLGVLLYELLTGTTPLEKQRFKEAAWDEIKRLIREEEPPRPSTRLSSANTLASLAAGRQLEPAKLTKLVRGELDWIVMKSLEKDRARRYETANGFALDIQRYLAGEPVLAAPPSTRYRLSKFARKHKAGLTTAAAISLLLVTGVAVSAWQAVRATQSEAAARDAEQAALQAQQAETDRAEGERLAKLDAEAKKLEAERARVRAEAGEKLASERLVQVEAEKKKAEAEKKKAEDEKQVAEAVKSFLHYKLLAQADTTLQADMLLRAGESSWVAKLNPTIRELLDRAAKELAPDKIDANFPKQPLSQAEILKTVGDTYRGIGELQPAIDLLRRSEFLYRQHLGLDDHRTLDCMSSLAWAYRGAGKLDLALPIYEETLKLTKAKLGPEHPETLKSKGNLAVAYQVAGKWNLALPLFEETLKVEKATLGPEHLETLVSMNNLAVAYGDAGKLNLAVSLFEQTLKAQKAKLGPEHPETLNTMNNLAWTYLEAGRRDLALPLQQETLKLRKAKLGPEHPETLTSMNNLAEAYRHAGKLDLALPLFEETLTLMKSKLGTDHPLTLGCMNNLARTYGDSGKLGQALPLSEETMTLMKAKLGPEHPDTLRSMSNVAWAYRATGKLDRALRLFEETLKGMKTQFGPEHPETLNIMGNLGAAYCEANQGTKAATTLKEFVAGQRKRPKRDDPQSAGLLAEVSLDLLKCGQHAAAEEFLRECLSIREKTQPDLWTTFNTKSMLGGALLGQKNYADAEPLLLAGYEGMKHREKKIPPQGKRRIAEAIERLVQLYEATERKEEAAKWRKVLENQAGRKSAAFTRSSAANSRTNPQPLDKAD